MTESTAADFNVVETMIHAAVSDGRCEEVAWIGLYTADPALSLSKVGWTWKSGVVTSYINWSTNDPDRTYSGNVLVNRYIQAFQDNASIVQYTRINNVFWLCNRVEC